MPYYVTEKVETKNAEEALRSIFPEGKANDLNWCFFSTSGLHGSYASIEECLAEETDVTFLVLKPRIVQTLYGTVPVTLDNVDFLISLRETTREKAAQIGEKS